MDDDIPLEAVPPGRMPERPAPSGSGAEYNVRLVDRIRRGDAAAGDDLCRVFGPRIEALLRLKGCAREVAEDIRQDTLMIALHKIPQGDPREPDKLGSFLMGIAKHRQKALAQQHGTRLTSPRSDLVELAPGQAPSAHEHYLAAQRRGMIDDVLARMPNPRYQVFLAEWYLEERTREEIAASQGVAAAHVPRVVYRAKAQFHEVAAARYGDALRDVFPEDVGEPDVGPAFALRGGEGLDPP